MLTDLAMNLGETDTQLLPNVIVVQREDAETTKSNKTNDRRYGLLDAIKAMAEGQRKAGLNGTTDNATEIAVAPPVYTSFLLVAMRLESSEKFRKSIDIIVGCNALCITTSEEARTRFDQGFECMVTPVARELRLELHGSTFGVESIERCGGDGEGRAVLEGDGEFYRVRSIFPQPSASLATDVRGGVILFKLEPLEFPSSEDKPCAGATTTVAMFLETPEGGKQVSYYTVSLPCFHPKPGATGKDRWRGFEDSFQSPSIRKAIALSRYTEYSKQLLREWGGYSLKHVPVFKEYFESTARLIDDESMLKEVELWDQLVEVKREHVKNNRSRCCCSVL